MIAGGSVCWRRRLRSGPPPSAICRTPTSSTIMPGEARRPRSASGWPRAISLLAGRYSEWEYYNSDHAFLAGKRAADEVRQAASRQMAQFEAPWQVGKAGASQQAQ